jgi:hypothetical protein
MKFILIIVASLTVRVSGAPGVATAEFDDEAACKAAQVKLAEEYVIKQAVPGAVLSTMCLPKSSVASAK